MEYQETMNLWKQPDHVLGILLEPPKESAREGKTFLELFYEGTFVFLFFRTKLLIALLRER